MSKIEAKLTALGLTLPPAPVPPPGLVLPFQFVKIHGSRALISGHGPQNPDGTFSGPFGKVGGEVSIEQGYRAARLTALSILGSLQRALGDLDRIRAWGRVFGMVSSAPGFHRQPSVINGFSDLILEVFGPEIGAHTRSAVGMAELPFNLPVEIEGEVEVAGRQGTMHRMPNIATFLTFNNQAEEAARFYVSIFPNSKITKITHFPDLTGLPPAGSVMTVEFTLLSREFVALNGGPQFTFSQGFSIAVLCDTQQQVDEYWDKFIKAGGTPIACGWINDHFGVSWQIDPKLLIDMITDPDPAKASKAMQAMMTMVKIDSEKLKQAWRA